MQHESKEVNKNTSQLLTSVCKQAMIYKKFTIYFSMFYVLCVCMSAHMCDRHCRRFSSKHLQCSYNLSPTTRYIASEKRNREKYSKHILRQISMKIVTKTNKYMRAYVNVRKVKFFPLPVT